MNDGTQDDKKFTVSTKESDLIASIGEGKAHRFHEKASKFSTFGEKSCILLELYKLEEFRDTGRHDRRCQHEDLAKVSNLRKVPHPQGLI